MCVFFFSSRRRHTRCLSDWSSDVCSSDLSAGVHKLLRDGARLVESWTDVVQELPDAWRRRVRDTGVATIEAAQPSKGSDEERSEERRVGKECGCRRWAEDEKRKT